ncbi:MAG: hypothetical protein K8T20_04085 [Planctomycetes bacterium]|nr:hypothetical protein [Planctomycetota bacterium]
MPSLDPQALVPRIAAGIPSGLRKHAYLVGSLAAAWHYREQLRFRAIRTKDADVVIQPVGAAKEIARIAQSLRKKGWRWLNIDERGPGTAATPEDELAAIRLTPPTGDDDYFIEFLGLPEVEQSASKRWVRVILKEGHFGVPCFRFMGVTARNLRLAVGGLKYADPAMMALSNLLSHPKIGNAEMSSPINGRKCLRSAKDLGRVLAFARLQSRAELSLWKDPWLEALRAAFPKSWRKMGAGVGAGVRELLSHRRGLDDALWTAGHGLLVGMNVTAENLRGLGLQLLRDLIEPFEKDCCSSSTPRPGPTR